MQRFRGGLVLKAHRLCVSLNSRLESNIEEQGGAFDHVLDAGLLAMHPDLARPFEVGYPHKNGDITPFSDTICSAVCLTPRPHGHDLLGRVSNTANGPQEAHPGDIPGT